MKTDYIFNILALLCAIPTAFLAFKNRFKENFKTQCEEIIRKENKDYKKDIRLDYRLLALMFYGLKDTKNAWMRIFMGPDDEIVKRMEFDRSDAVRGLFWFCTSVLFALLAIILNIFSR